jgi:hypothetical protein
MSPELQQLLTAITKFADKTEAKEWFKLHKGEIIPLLADLYETEPSNYQGVINDILGNFPHGTIKTIRDDIQNGVKNLLAQRLQDRLKPHWIDPDDAPDIAPDSKPTQRLLVEILQKSKYINVVYEEHRKSNDFEVYGDYRLPWATSEANSLRMEYQVDHKEKNVRNVTYYPADLKYQQSALKYYMANFFTQEVDWKALRDSVTYTAHLNKVNVVQDYFNNGIEEWDGKDRMDMLYRLAGAKNERWARIVLRLLMLSIMARTFQPGYDFRVAVILVGDENMGKSWFTRQLCIHQRFYLQFTFSKYSSEAEIGRMLEGRMVVELPDTGGIGTRNDNAIKSFLTQTYDNFRRMRADTVEDIARSCVFVVTANSMEYYLGHIGNTRFWPLEVGKFDMEAILLEMPQLFAQAKYMWDHGETPRATDEELALQQEMMLQQEVKPNFYYLLLKQLKIENYAKYFVLDANGYDEGLTITEMLGWFENEVWYSSNHESKYRKDIINVLKKYFYIESKVRKVPILKRTVADKPETNRRYRYFGNMAWNEFIRSLEE